MIDVNEDTLGCARCPNINEEDCQACEDCYYSYLELLDLEAEEVQP